MNKRYSIRNRIILLAATAIGILIASFLIFYGFYSRITDRQAESSFTSLAEKSHQNITARLEAIRSLASATGYSSGVQEFLLSMSNTDRVRMVEPIRKTLDLSMTATEGALGVFIHASNGMYLYTTGASATWATYFNAFQNNNAWAEKNITRDFFASQKTSDSDGVYVYFKPIAPLAYNGKSLPRGQKIVSAVLFRFADLLDRENDGRSALELVAFEGQLAASSDESFPADCAFLQDAISRDRVVSISGRQYYAAVYSLFGDENMQYFYLVPRDAFSGSLASYVSFVLAAAGGFALLLLALLFFILRSISRPLRAIELDVQKIPIGNSVVARSVARDFDPLTDTINEMLRELNTARIREKEAQEQLYQANLQQTRAELMGYRSQINPHFLLNTIESMNGMARYYKVKPLIQLLGAMSASFRYTLRAPMMVEFEDEVRHLNNYIEMFQIRKPGHYRLIQQVDPDALSCSVLSLILQPIAENAIVHGFHSYEKPAMATMLLRASLSPDGQRLLIRFTDNGMGISPDRLTALKEAVFGDSGLVTEHIGLGNIWKRLKLSYGSDAAMDIISREGFYTIVEITVPAQKRLSPRINPP